MLHAQFAKPAMQSNNDTAVQNYKRAMEYWNDYAALAQQMQQDASKWPHLFQGWMMQLLVHRKRAFASAWQEYTTNIAVSSVDELHFKDLIQLQTALQRLQRAQVTMVVALR